MYEYTCQVCGERRYGVDGNPYVEAHHLRPLGAPHEGPDTPENILILCPNHHADFDYGQITVDPDTHRISHSYEDAIDGTTLTMNEAHDLSETHLEYHNELIATNG